MDRETEIKAIQAVLDGDSGAFAKIVRGTQNLVASVAWKMNVPQDSIEDVVSEVFIKVYRNLHRYDSQYAFSTWLYRLTTNHILDRMRKAKRRPETDLENIPELTSGDETAESGLQVRERATIVRETINTLPDIYREVLVLHHLEGLSVADVSQTLGLPQGTVKVRLMRGRDRLRVALEQGAPDYFGETP